MGHGRTHRVSRPRPVRVGRLMFRRDLGCPARRLWRPRLGRRSPARRARARRAGPAAQRRPGARPRSTGRSVDLTREAPTLDDLEARFLVVALTARPRTEEAYRATYVDGMRRALDALATAGTPPSGPSSSPRPPCTGVDSAGARGRDDARTTRGRAGADAARGRGALPRAPCRTAPSCGSPACTAAAAPGSWTRCARVGSTIRTAGPTGSTARTPRQPSCTCSRWPGQPGRLYLGTDDEPAQLGDVAAYLAKQLGAPTPPTADPDQGHGKRLSNARLRATGWRLTRPSYREGYAGIG